MPKILLAFVIFFSMSNFSHASPAGLKKLLLSQGYIEIPLKRNAVGHLEIHGEINGIQGRFTLDTGASGTVLDRKRSSKFKLSKALSTTTAGGLGASKQKAEKKKLKRLKLGGYETNEMKVTVVDLSEMNMALEAQGVKPQDGVIGADILNGGNAIIDYKNNILYLTKKNGEQVSS